MKKATLLFLILAGCQGALQLGSYSELEVHTTEGSNFGVVHSLSNLSISRKHDEPIKKIYSGKLLFGIKSNGVSVSIHTDSLGLNACQVALLETETVRQYLSKITKSSAAWLNRATVAPHQINVELVLTKRHSFEYRSVSVYLNAPTLSLAFSLGSSCDTDIIKAKLIDAIAQTMHEIVHVDYLLNNRSVDALIEEKSAYRVQYCAALSMDESVQIPISDYISSAASVQELTEKILSDADGQEAVTRGILANAIVLFELSSKAGSRRLTHAALSGPLGAYCSSSL